MYKCRIEQMSSRASVLNPISTVCVTHMNRHFRKVCRTQIMIIMNHDADQNETYECFSWLFPFVKRQHITLDPMICIWVKKTKSLTRKESHFFPTFAALFEWIIPRSLRGKTPNGKNPVLSLQKWFHHVFELIVVVCCKVQKTFFSENRKELRTCTHLSFVFESW
jgi:hypothetical protein